MKRGSSAIGIFNEYSGQKIILLGCELCLKDPKVNFRMCARGWAPFLKKAAIALTLWVLFPMLLKIPQRCKSRRASESRRLRVKS